MYRKLLVLSAAFVLTLFVRAIPVSAQVCLPPDPVCTDTDGDGIVDAVDPCPLFPNAGDADCDGIPDAQDTCDNLLDPVGCADDDGDGIVNKDDECDSTNAEAVGSDLVIGTCTVTGVIDTLAANGCSLSDILGDCATGASNHGKYVSCIAKATNALKKAKTISGAQKGQIQSCAARSSTGKPPKPPKP